MGGAEVDGRVVGAAKMGPQPAGAGRPVGTASFSRGPARPRASAWAGAGWAFAAWHRAQGFRAIQFNAVVETNTAAVRLWRSLGSTVVGHRARALPTAPAASWSGCTSCTSTWRG